MRSRDRRRWFTLLTLIFAGCSPWSRSVTYESIDAGPQCGGTPSAVEAYSLAVPGSLALLIDGDQLLVGTDDGILPVGLTPCAPDQQLSMPYDAQTRLARDSSSIYTAPLDVTDIGSGASQLSEVATSIAAIDKASGTKRVLVTGSDPITALAVDGQTLWFGTGSASAGTLSSVPIAGGEVNRVLSTPAAPWDLAISSDYVFVADGTQVTAVPRAGGDALVLATSTDQPCDVDLIDDWVYVVERGINPGDQCASGPSGGAIARVEQPPPFATPATWPTSSLETVVSDSDGPLNLVSDATNLYWTSWAGLKRTPVAGGTVETLLGTAVDSIVQTDTAIYASEPGATVELYVVPK